MYVTLDGKRWKFRFADLTHTEKVGDIDDPSVANKEIRVERKLKNERQLEIIIHEVMHALDWKKDEQYVTSEAKELARLLWRLGYRKTEHES